MDSADPANVDVEKATAAEYREPRSNAVEVAEASALLLLWSILVINEGAIRFIRSTPSDLDTFVNSGSKFFSSYLVFFGGLFEVIFGLIGVFVGFSAFILRMYSPVLTKLSMVVQSLLGWFVFIVFVFAEPAVKASNLADPILPGLTLGSSRFIITLGILTSFHFCLALQGGQFVFFARLVTAATGEDFLKQKTGNAMRAIFWNANIAFAGLWTLITGAVINSQVGSGKLDVTYVSPPNVGRLPGLTIFMGLLMILFGLAGITLGIAKSAPVPYFLLTGVVYIMALLNFGIVQFGMFADRTAGGPIAMHNGLVFMVLFLGPYFVLKTVHEKEDEM